MEELRCVDQNTATEKSIKKIKRKIKKDKYNMSLTKSALFNTKGLFTKSVNFAAGGVFTSSGKVSGPSGPPALSDIVSTYFSTTTPTFINDIAIDSNLNIYLLDRYHIIWKLNSSLTFTQFAGSNSGYLDATGTSAQFGDDMKAITIDPSGNIFVSDTNNNCIRKITPGGVVTTVAGTKGTNGNTGGQPGTSQITSPVVAMTSDTAGNIYFINNISPVNVTLCKIDTANNMTILNGAGTAGQNNGAISGAQFLSFSQYMKCDKNNNLYLIENTTGGGATYYIRKISLSTSTVTTLFSTSTPISSLVPDSYGNLFIGSRTNNIIYKLDTSLNFSAFAGTGAPSTLNGPGASAQFNFSSSNPQFGPGITVDSNNKIYITEQTTGPNNTNIRLIS